jgi:PAS domain S-box-containing protein
LLCGQFTASSVFTLLKFSLRLNAHSSVKWLTEASAMHRNIHLLSLIEKEKLEELLDSFTEVTGVAAIITEVDGRPITKQSNFSGLCRNYSRSTAKGRRKCYDSDSYGGRETKRLKKGQIYECLNAGLLDCGAPIIVQGYHLANILCGQVLERPISTEIAVQRAHAIDIVDLDGYLEALKEIPIMSHKRLRSIVSLMEIITQTISELALQKFLLQQNSQQYLNKLINSVTDGIIATDAETAICVVNESGARIFGFDAQQLVGRSILSLLADEKSKETYQAKIGNNLNGHDRCELVAKNAHNQSFPVHVSISKIDLTDDRSPGYVAVIHDVSEEKQMQRMKEDLIGMLTHEMQNPILSIQKSTDLLVNETVGGLNGKQRELLNLTSGTTRQMLGLVTDFLDIYRNENGQFLLHRFSFDLNQIFREVIAQLLYFANEKHISIETKLCSAPVVFDGDWNRLIRMFVNLLDHAIKYSPEGGNIDVCCRLLTPGSKDYREVKAKLANLWRSYPSISDRQHVMVSISDRGNGFAEDFRKYRFDPFCNSKVKTGNVRKGLGLAYCNLVAEAHGGILWTTSPPARDERYSDHGCHFNLILPMHAAK